MPMADLRYIYHMALVDGMLDASGTSNMCLLWGEIRMYVQSWGISHALALCFWSCPGLN